MRKSTLFDTLAFEGYENDRDANTYIVLDEVDRTVSLIHNVGVVMEFHVDTMELTIFREEYGKTPYVVLEWYLEFLRKNFNVLVTLVNTVDGQYKQLETRMGVYKLKQLIKEAE